MRASFRYARRSQKAPDEIIIGEDLLNLNNEDTSMKTAKKAVKKPAAKKAPVAKKTAKKKA
jgi:hypothetical protein